jgi:hypothetical protein
MICFTICLFIGPDLDGNRGTKNETLCPERLYVKRLLCLRDGPCLKPSFPVDNASFGGFSENIIHDMFVYYCSPDSDGNPGTTTLWPGRPTVLPICFTICLFISPDLDGLPHKGPQGPNN